MRQIELLRLKTNKEIKKTNTLNYLVMYAQIKNYKVDLLALIAYAIFVLMCLAAGLGEDIFTLFK